MDVSANNTITIGGGCAGRRTIDVSTPTKALYGYLNMEDKNGNETIDDVPWYSLSREGYRREMDLNGDGHITTNEAWQAYSDNLLSTPYRPAIDDAVSSFLRNDDIPRGKKEGEILMMGVGGGQDRAESDPESRKAALYIIRRLFLYRFGYQGSFSQDLEDINLFHESVRDLTDKGFAEIGARHYRDFIPALVHFMTEDREQCNPWKEVSCSRESYIRPNYEAAGMIGWIALKARQENDFAVLGLIKKVAVPQIFSLLEWKNISKIDYGFAYIEYPMKKTLIEALMNIGDPIAIPHIKACPDINYRSPYNHNYYSVADTKSVAIEYLVKQKKNKTFIEPPQIWQDQ